MGVLLGVLRTAIYKTVKIREKAAIHALIFPRQDFIYAGGANLIETVTITSEKSLIPFGLI